MTSHDTASSRAAPVVAGQRHAKLDRGQWRDSLRHATLQGKRKVHQMKKDKLRLAEIAIADLERRNSDLRAEIDAMRARAELAECQLAVVRAALPALPKPSAVAAAALEAWGGPRTVPGDMVPLHSAKVTGVSIGPAVDIAALAERGPQPGYGFTAHSAGTLGGSQPTCDVCGVTITYTTP